MSIKRVPVSEVANLPFEYKEESIVSGVKELRSHLIKKGIVKPEDKDTVSSFSSSIESGRAVHGKIRFSS